METTVGNQYFTANGTVSPYGVTRIYYINAVSTLSTSHLTLHNSTVSGTNTALLKCTSDSQGLIDYGWVDGVLFTNGVYLNTGAAITFALVGYSSVKA